MRSFKKIATGFAVAATTSLGVFFPVLEVKATPSLGEDRDHVTHVEPCVPRVTVSDNVVDNTIRIQVVEGNTCPISDKVFLFIQDNRPQPLRLPGILTEQNLWVVSPGDARPGRYRVMGLNPMPGGIGDDEYISAYHLGIDQVITIGISSPTVQASLQPHPVAPPPQVVAPPQQVVTTLDTESKQLLRTNTQLMIWFKLVVWPKIQAFIRAIEGSQNI
jgi:hypothetical protein